MVGNVDEEKWLEGKRNGENLENLDTRVDLIKDVAYIIIIIINITIIMIIIIIIMIKPVAIF